VLVHEGLKAAQGQPNLYNDMIQVFLNNIRLYVPRYCSFFEVPKPCPFVLTDSTISLIRNANPA
jgi:hypothetical protein